MIDTRTHVKKILDDLNDTLDDDKKIDIKLHFPKSVIKTPMQRPLVTFNEISNNDSQYGVIASVSFQIDVWCDDFEKCIDTMMLVDDAIRVIGWRRDYVSSDDDIVDASGLYRKVMRYARRIDTRSNRLID